MATVAELRAEIDGLKTDVTNAIAEVDKDFIALQAQIDALKAQPSVSQTDLDDMNASVQAARAKLQAVNPVPGN